MSSILQSIGSIRRKLDFPDEAKLSDGMIAEYLIETVDYLITELQQTNAEWFISSTIIDVSANEDTYPLDGAVAGFGKARDVWSIDDSDVNHRRQVVNIVSYEDLNSYYHGGDRPLGGTYWKHNSQACAFVYNQDEGRQEIIFAPVPSQTVQYKLVYEPDVVRAPTTSGTAFRLRQFDALVSDKAAIKCIRHCEWKGLDTMQARAKANDLRGDISTALMEEEDQFRRFKWSNINANDNSTIGFGAGRW